MKIGEHIFYPKDWGVPAILAGVALVVLTLIGGCIYYGFTGGFTYTDRQKVGGVTCIVVHDRLTGEPNSVSCPPVQPRR